VKDSTVLSRKEVAVLLGKLLRSNGAPLTVRSVHNWTRRGLPRVKIGGVVAFREDAVRKWVAAHLEGWLF
jgi:phage terminase Nu1 subunit (DNA packaging protein)